MKVRIINSAAGLDYVVKKGEELEMPEDRALQFIRDGIAEAMAVNPAKKAEKADDVKAYTREKRHKR